MKKGFKYLISILVAILIGIAGFAFSDRAHAEAEAVNSKYLLLDEAGNTYYESNVVAGTTTGYTSEAVGGEITIKTTPSSNFVVWGWSLDDGTNEYIIRNTTSIQVHYLNKTNEDTVEDIIISLSNEKKDLTIGKLWTDLVVEPIFDRVRFSVQTDGLFNISDLISYNDDIYYQSETTDGEYSVLNNAFYFVNSKWYFISKIYVKDDVCYLKEETLEEPARDRFIPLSANAYTYGESVNVVGDVVSNPYMEIRGIAVDGESQTLADVLTKEEIVLDKGVYRTTGYQIPTTIEKDTIVSADSRKMYTVSLEIKHDGTALVGGYEFEDEIKVGAGVTIPDTWHDIGNNQYIVYEDEPYTLRAKNIEKIVKGINYKYFTAYIDGYKTTSKYVASISSDIAHTVNFESVQYGIEYSAVLFTPSTPGSDTGIIKDLTGMNLPTNPNRIIRGHGTEKVTLDADTMSGTTNVGYRFVGWILDDGSIDYSSVEKFSELELALDSNEPQNLKVYACFELIEYTIKLNVGEENLNDGIKDIYSINQAYIQRSKVQSGYTIEDATNEPYILTFDMSFKLGDKVKFILTPSLGFDFKGISLKQDIDTADDYITGELELTQALLNGVVDDTIVVYVDAYLTEYTIEYTASNYTISELVVDASKESETVETINDQTDTYVEKIVYSGLHLYDSVILNSTCTNSTDYMFVGYFKGNERIGNSNPYTFTITSANLNWFDGGNTVGIVVKYQSKTASLTVSSNKNITFNLDVSPIIDKVGDVYNISTGDLTLTISNIQFGYQLIDCNIYALDTNSGEVVMTTVAANGNSITTTITGEGSRTIVLNFSPINYTINVVDLDDSTHTYSPTANVENLNLNVARYDNRYYVMAVYPMVGDAPNYSKLLTFKEANNEYVERLTNLKSAQSKTSVAGLTGNGISIGLTADELEDLVKHFTYDDTITLGVKFVIAKYNVEVEKVADSGVNTPSIQASYSFNNENYVVVAGTDISSEANRITYRVPVESSVNLVATFPKGVEIKYWDENGNKENSTTFSFGEVYEDRKVELHYSWIDYSILINSTIPENATTDARPYIVKNNLQVGTVNVGNDFIINANSFEFKKSGLKVALIYYYKEYNGEDNKVLYTRQISDDEVGGYKYIEYTDEIDDNKTYYYREYFDLYDTTSGRVAYVYGFDPDNFAMENNTICVYARYSYIAIELIFTTAENSVLMDAGVIVDFASYNTSKSVTYLTVNSGTITITPVLKTVQLPIVSGSQDSISVDLSRGVRVKNVAKLLNQDVYLYDNKLTLNMADLFAAGLIDYTTGEIEIVFDYEVETKNITLTTQVPIPNETFYSKIQLMVGGSVVTAGVQKPLNFLDRFNIQFAWTNSFGDAFKIRKIIVYSGGNKYEVSATNIGVSTLSVSSNEYINVLLLQDVTIEFQVEAIVWLEQDGARAELTHDAYINRIFNYDKDLCVAKEYKASDITEISVHNSIKGALKLSFNKPAVYVDNYTISIHFDDSVENYEWLSHVNVDYKVFLSIGKLILDVKFDSSDVEQIEITYDATTDFNILSYDEIISNLYFSKGASFWFKNNTDPNIKLTSSKIVSYRANKNAGERDLICSNFKLKLLPDESNKQILDSIEIRTDSLTIESLILVNKKVIKIYNYDVYDKAYDGGDIAIPKNIENVSWSGIIAGDSVAFNVRALEPKFTDGTISANEKDKDVIVTIGNALTGEDSINYAYETYHILNKTIYPKVIEVELEGVGSVRVENRAYSADPSKAGIIPVGSKLNVIKVVRDDDNYIKHYSAISKQLSNGTVFNEGYIVALNGNLPDRDLTLVFHSLKSGTLYAVDGDDSSKVEYKVENGEVVVKMSDVPLNTAMLFMVQGRRFLEPWQILLIVLAILALIAIAIVVIVVIRKKKRRDYGINEKI